MAELWLMGGVLFGLAACGSGERRDAPPPWTQPQPTDELHPVTIARPPAAGTLRTPLSEPGGTPATIGCATCHAAGAEAPLVAKAGPGDFHSNIELRHAQLECVACHTKEAPQQLRLASGKQIPIAESMTLCSQCHGPIRKAYDHGAHGGKRGYWDRQRGPQTRNDCITCHDPHAPDYPDVVPVAGPRERFAPEPHHARSYIEERFSGGQH